jgi:hypothetical protein
VRILGISSSIAFVALNAFIVLAFLLSSGAENLTSTEMETRKLMVAVGGVLFVFAVATLIGVVRERRGWALRAFAAQFAFCVLALVYALPRSTHSDGKLMVVALGIELTGLAAVAFGFGPTMRRDDR